MKTRMISENRLIELLKKEQKLNALESWGVDNWRGYDVALNDEILIHSITEEDLIDFPLLKKM